MRASIIRRALNIGSRKACGWAYTDCRGVRKVVTGKAIDVVTTARGISIKLDSGKTVVVRCNRHELCQVFGLI